MVLEQQQRIKTNILVIGGGSAGLRAAITAIPKDVQVLL
jgi:succinate dehydrogenase/fumarate reductase flavoprotein subunit